MSADARHSWRAASPRWPASSETSATSRQTSTTRRPKRLGFARIAESVVAESQTWLPTPVPLFELALKYVAAAHAPSRASTPRFTDET
jgi:hypothetical protein